MNGFRITCPDRKADPTPGDSTSSRSISRRRITNGRTHALSASESSATGTWSGSFARHLGTFTGFLLILTGSPGTTSSVNRTFAERWRALREVLDGEVLVAHQAHFDRDILSGLPR